MSVSAISRPLASIAATYRELDSEPVHVRNAAETYEGGLALLGAFVPWGGIVMAAGECIGAAWTRNVPLHVIDRTILTNVVQGLATGLMYGWMATQGVAQDAVYGSALGVGLALGALSMVRPLVGQLRRAE